MKGGVYRMLTDIGEKGFLFTIYMVQNHISSVFI